MVTKETAIRIGLDLQKIALALDNATYYKIKPYLDDIEQLIMKETGVNDDEHGADIY